MMSTKSTKQLLMIFLVLGAAASLFLLHPTSYPVVFRGSNSQNRKINSKNIDCAEKKNIVFLKTHKTGGTTLARIIEQYAYDNKLNVVRKIGEGGSIHFGNRNFNFDSKRLFLPPMGVESGNYEEYRYNVFTLHSRYNRPVYDAFMELNSMYITIIRDPVAQFESAFDFFHVGSILNRNTTEKPLNKTQKLELFFEDVSANWRNLSLTKKKFSYNNQIWDLGVDPALCTNDFLIDYNIQRLDDEIDFVLINEFYDESLIIMKKMLCWQFSDILYLPRNQRGERAVIDAGLSRKIAQWNAIDTKMYHYFVKRLQDHIKNYGPAFQADLTAFKSMTSFLYKTCVSGEEFKRKRINYEKRGNYTSDICQSHDSLDVCDFGNGYILTLDLNLVCERVTSNPRALNRDIRNMMKG
ncbi:galactosylceramide sulfotransferase-like [Anneissia japonica]|uniref:galactosylceramide sulfotransferase-like n=1 Tax=Anneissia japonica TaxID=1529436 RepID=UPI001425A717|nr:galactosylceramide sulfotransferase-like [Anneissia japonica]